MKLVLLELLKRREVDLMLLDMKLPGLDGFGVLNEVRETLHKHFPVIMMTAYGEQQIIEQALAFGDVKYVMKLYWGYCLRR